MHVRQMKKKIHSAPHRPFQFNAISGIIMDQKKEIAHPSKPEVSKKNLKRNDGATGSEARSYHRRCFCTMLLDSIHGQAVKYTLTETFAIVE